MDFLYLLHSLLRRKWIIIICSVIGATAGILFGTLKQKEYVSLSQYSTGFTMEKKVKIQQEESYNLYEIDNRFSNVIAAFASDKVLGMLTYKLTLHDLEDGSPFRSLSEEQKKNPAYTSLDTKKARQILRKKISELELLSFYDPEEKKVIDLIKLYGYDAESLMRKLSLERNGRTDFINIFASSENPYLSAYMANTAGDQLIRFFDVIYGVRTQSASGKLDSITTRKKDIVDSLAERLRSFKAKSGPSTSGEKATAAMQVVAELYKKYQEETRELNRLRSEKKAIEEQISSLGSDPVAGTNPSAGNNKEILRLKQRNEDIEKEMAGKSEDEKRKLRAELESNLNRIIALTPAKGVDRNKETDRKNTRREELMQRKIELENELIATEINQAQFEREKKRYEDMIQRGGGDDVVVKEMERELELATKEYEGLRQSLQSKLDIDVNPENNFKQTLVGMPAASPTPSRRMLLGGIAGFLMLFFSALAIILLEFIDGSFKTPQIFEKTTGTTLLTSVNKVEFNKKSLESYFNPESIGDGKDNQVFLENFRRLRYEIERSGRKTILVTSAKKGEGKSMLIEALAHSFSMAHRKVLVIDANFSNNELTRKFEGKPALDQIQSASAAEVAEKVGQQSVYTPIEGVKLLGCKQANVTPSEVLPANNIFKHLSESAAKYDLVLIEVSNLNDHPDARELAAYVDGVIGVFAATSPYGQSEKESIAYLKSLEKKYAGSVLNKVELYNMEL